MRSKEFFLKKKKNFDLCKLFSVENALSEFFKNFI